MVITHTLVEKSRGRSSRFPALGLGKWESNRNKPLDLKWFHSPVKILGIYFSYNIKENNELNLDKKIQKLQTKLDMWSSQDLTIFGRAMLIKTLGLLN